MAVNPPAGEDALIFTFPAGAIDLKKTFTCGQCFRWRETAPGEYLGVAGGRAAVARKQGESVTLSGQGDGAFWRRYFDLGRDYAGASAQFLATGGYLRLCAQYGAGIRILRQDAWETLVSFILSQCSNIPRIQKSVAALCGAYGAPIDFCGRRLRAFPAPARLAGLEEEDLAPLRLGYRAPYVLAAARAVRDGDLDLDALARSDRETAVARLEQLPGVGPKVANCVALYGLHMGDCFPVDTWMRRALKAHFPPDFDPKSLGEFAGLAQQYIFYYARSAR